MTDADKAGAGGASRYEQGLGLRRAVLGDQHVDRSLASATEFSRPMQDYVTEFCWTDIWGRPGLDRRTRSLLNLAMLTSLNRMHEFAALASYDLSEHARSELPLSPARLWSPSLSWRRRAPRSSS